MSKQPELLKRRQFWWNNAKTYFKTYFKGTVSEQYGFGRNIDRLQLDIHLQKYKPCLIYKKSKWTICLNVKPKPIKLLEYFK